MLYKAQVNAARRFQTVGSSRNLPATPVSGFMEGWEGHSYAPCVALAPVVQPIQGAVESDHIVLTPTDIKGVHVFEGPTPSAEAERGHFPLKINCSHIRDPPCLRCAAF